MCGVARHHGSCHALRLLLMHQNRQQRPKRLQLSLRHRRRRALLLGECLFDFRQQFIDGVRIATQFHQSGFPWTKFGIFVGQLVHRLLEFHEPPDAQLVPMVFRRRPVKLGDRRVGLAAIVQQVGQVHARFGKVGIKRQGTTQRDHRVHIMSKPMLGIADARNRFRRIRRLRDTSLKKHQRIVDEPLAEQRAADLQHQVHVVFVAKFDRALKLAHSLVHLPELEQDLAKSSQRVFMLRVQRQPPFKTAPCPRILVAREARISSTDMQLDGIRISHQAFAQQVERCIVLSLVVQGVRALVVLLGTQERCGHASQTSGADGLPHDTVRVHNKFMSNSTRCAQSSATRPTLLQSGPPASRSPPANPNLFVPMLHPFDAGPRPGDTV